MELHHIKESKDCISAELMEAYLKAVHHHAEFLPAKERDGGNLDEKRQPPNIEEEELDPLSQFTKTEGGDVPSYCKQAYAGLHRHDASSPEECATECLKDRNCRHFMWHKGDISQAKCRLSHMCMVYTESKDDIDGYLLNVYTTTTTTTKVTVGDKITLSGADLRTKGTLFKDNLDKNELSGDGSSLLLSSSGEYGVPLWSMPVQDASCFSDNGDYTISGKVDYSRVDLDYNRWAGGDNRLMFGIHDGSSTIGIRRHWYDASAGQVQLYYGNKG